LNSFYFELFNEKTIFHFEFVPLIVEFFKQPPIPYPMLDPVRLQHFRNLVSLSAVDGNIKEVERVALSQIAFEREIPLDRLNIMLSRANEYTYLIPQNLKEKETQLHEMIDLALIDGELSAAELELITLVAEKLGFTKTELDKIMEGHLKT